MSVCVLIGFQIGPSLKRSQEESQWYAKYSSTVLDAEATDDDLHYLENTFQMRYLLTHIRLAQRLGLNYSFIKAQYQSRHEFETGGFYIILKKWRKKTRHPTCSLLHKALNSTGLRDEALLFEEYLVQRYVSESIEEQHGGEWLEKEIEVKTKLSIQRKLQRNSDLEFGEIYRNML